VTTVVTTSLTVATTMTTVTTTVATAATPVATAATTAKLDLYFEKSTLIRSSFGNKV